MTTYDEYGVPVGAYSEPESLTHQAWRLARALFLYRIRPTIQGQHNVVRRGNWSFKRLFTLVNALVLLWWFVLYWGERGVFNGAVGSCAWDQWENWVCHNVSTLDNNIRSLLYARKPARTLTDSFSSPTPNSSIRTHILAARGPSILLHTSTLTCTCAAHTLVFKLYSTRTPSSSSAISSTAAASGRLARPSPQSSDIANMATTFG